MPLLDNSSQVFRFGGNIHGPQNPVSSLHQQAVDQTAEMRLYHINASATFGCARYHANPGNPTKSCADAGCSNAELDKQMLPETEDPIDPNHVVPARTGVGMSQNGSAAWAAGAAPWDFRQILSHYYRNVGLGTNLDNTNQYRWVWLDVGSTAAHSSFWEYQEIGYAKPIAYTPSVLIVNKPVTVPFRIKNTGSAAWFATGANSVRLSYRIYTNPTGGLIYNGGETALPATVSPGGIVNLNALLLAPVAVGSYTVKWDLKVGNSWFSERPQLFGGQWPSQNVNVSVFSSLNNVYVPTIRTAILVQ